MKINNRIMAFFYYRTQWICTGVYNRISKARCKNKEVSFIANNCVGGMIAKRAGIRYCSPTVGMQILPAYYNRFVMNLPYYLSQEVKEVTDLTDYQILQINRTFQKHYGVSKKGGGEDRLSLRNGCGCASLLPALFFV